MPLFARQVSNLIDHLEHRLGGRRRHLAGRQRRARAGHARAREGARAVHRDAGARQRPDRRRRRSSRRSCSACASGGPCFELASRLTSAVPRTNYLVDIGLDCAAPAARALAGGARGPAAGRDRAAPRGAAADRAAGPDRRPHPRPGPSLQRLRACSPKSSPNATLIEANSILEWRLTPGRLDDELSAFLDRVWDVRS